MALPTEPVVQIIPMVTIVTVPQLTAAVAGVINVHGTAVPVVDLRVHLELPDLPWQLDTPIILLRVCGRTVGLIVDEVVDVLALDPAQVVPPADVLPPELGSAPVVWGLVNAPGGLLLVLDPDHLFLPHQAQACAQAAEYLRRLLGQNAAGAAP